MSGLPSSVMVEFHAIPASERLVLSMGKAGKGFCVSSDFQLRNTEASYQVGSTFKSTPQGCSRNLTGNVELTTCSRYAGRQHV